MPTIKVTDWTKSELDDVQDEEDHTSYDSVIKSLLNSHNTDGGT